MSELPTLDGQSAIVTGASAGIGRATAHELAAVGANVVLAARSADTLDTIAADITEEYGVEAVAVPRDVQDEHAVDALVETTVEEFDGLDILVNNAGLARGGAIADMTTDEYRTMMRTNVDGSFFTTRAALPHLQDSEGTLVFVASFAGEYPRPVNPVYAASKWWVRGFAKSLSGQVGGDVAVTLVNPSEVRSQFGPEYGTAYAEKYDPGEVTEPAEVARAIAFAARQSPSMIHELDITRRDKFELFGGR